MKIIIFITIFISSVAFANDREELRLMKEMYSIFAQNKDIFPPPGQMSLYFSGEPRKGDPKGFEGLSDAGKIRMVVSYLFHAPGVFPNHTDLKLYTFLKTFPDSIRDDSEYRKILANENDAKNFHKLSINLGGYFVANCGSTFISETAHMLMRDDPVAPIMSGETYNPTLDDISKRAYMNIMSYLKKLNAPYDEPPSDMPHEERKLRLARWLKENWPGCEDLALPGAGRAVKGGQARPELPAPPVASTSGPGDGEGREDPGKSPPRWAWVSVLAILAAALVAWFRSRLAKT